MNVWGGEKGGEVEDEDRRRGGVDGWRGARVRVKL